MVHPRLRLDRLASDHAGPRRRRPRLSRFFIAQLGINASFGLVIGLGLWAIGIPTPALWGGLAGLLRFVPYIGPFLAVVAAARAGRRHRSRLVDRGVVALLFVVVEPLTAYVVEPLIYGHSTGLSPASVIVAAIFWTWLWGPIGLLLSTPLTLCLVVMGRHVRSLGFFDVLLGDGPPLVASRHASTSASSPTTRTTRSPTRKRSSAIARCSTTTTAWCCRP